MTKRRIITRRRALIAGGTVVAGGALTLGGVVSYDQYKRFGRDALRIIPDHRVKLPASTPKMVIARGADPVLNVRASVERLGGMGRFVTPNDVVVIKPNIGWERTEEQAATTHPEVVAEVVRLCRETRAARVIVSDCPVKNSRKAFLVSGIQKAAADAGAEIIAPEDSQYHTVHISDRLGTWDVLEPFVIATKVINVPVAKNHSLTGVVAGMKNWIGITGKLRMGFHGDLQRSIAELAAMMNPTLTVIDASRVLMHNGPEGGNVEDVKQINAVAAGTDPVALDAWAFGLVGKPVDQMPDYLRLAQESGLGQIDHQALQPLEIITG